MDVAHHKNDLCFELGILYGSQMLVVPNTFKYCERPPSQISTISSSTLISLDGRTFHSNLVLQENLQNLVVKTILFRLVVQSQASCTLKTICVFPNHAFEQVLYTWYQIIVFPKVNTYFDFIIFIWINYNRKYTSRMLSGIYYHGFTHLINLFLCSLHIVWVHRPMSFLCLTDLVLFSMEWYESQFWVPCPSYLHSST